MKKTPKQPELHVSNEQALREQVSYLEQRMRGLENLIDEQRSELRETRKKLDHATGMTDVVHRENVSLQREIGRLEGYRMRVERVDDLARGVQPPDQLDGPARPRMDFELQNFSGRR